MDQVVYQKSALSYDLIHVSNTIDMNHWRRILLLVSNVKSIVCGRYNRYIAKLSICYSVVGHMLWLIKCKAAIHCKVQCAQDWNYSEIFWLQYCNSWSVVGSLVYTGLMCNLPGVSGVLGAEILNFLLLLVTWPCSSISWATFILTCFYYGL